MIHVKKTAMSFCNMWVVVMVNRNTFHYRACDSYYATLPMLMC